MCYYIPHETAILNAAREGNYLKFQTELPFFTSYSLNKVKDNNNNNLLHLAALSENVEIVGECLKNDVSYTKPNNQNKSPWNLAIMTQNNSVIIKFLPYLKSFYYGTSIEHQYRNTIVDLSEEIGKLNEQIKIHSNKISMLSADVFKLTGSLKRTTDENADLKENNKKLRQSVETLMENSRKR